MAEGERIANAYKLAKEKFVSGHVGGSVWEINAVTAVAPAAVLLWSTLQARYAFFEKSSPVTFLVDFLLNVCAILAATTIYADSPAILLALILFPAQGLYFSSQHSPYPARTAAKPPIAKPSSDGKGGFSEFPVRPFLTAYRGGMLVITNLAILAVDFPVFPRRFAKVETWGTSLMDVGVGSFVFSAGLVAAKASLKTHMALSEPAVLEEKRGKPIDKDTAAIRELVKTDPATREQAGLAVRLAMALRASFPLLVLGFIRLYSVKGLDYAEHVTEYGVHWNFFFTLASLPIGMALLEPLLSALPAKVPSHALLGLVLMLLHGLALDVNSTGLRAWVLTAPRTDLLSQNREGIVSFVGYLAIFLFGMEAGTIVLPRDPIAGLSALFSSSTTRSSSSTKSSPNPRTNRRNTLLLLAGSAIIYAILAYVLTNPIPILGLRTSISFPISRRLANPPYALWIAAFNHFQLLLYCGVETLLFPATYAAKSPEEEKRETSKATSRVLEAYNGSGLAIFLLANLLTGLVNLTTDTLGKGRVEAMGILLAYMGLVTAAAVGWRRMGWKLRL